MFLLSHPTGNTYVRNDLRALNDTGLLWRYVTALGFSSESAILGLPMPVALRNELSRRVYDLPKDLVIEHPCREIMRLAAGRLGLESLARHETGWASVDAVFHDLDRATATLIEQASKSSSPARAVITYEDGAELSLQTAREAGWLGVYHLPIAYGPFARRIYMEEAERLPSWAQTIQGDRDSPEKIARKVREASLASIIICPSRFVLESLPRNISETRPCHVIPYGAPPVPTAPDSRNNNGTTIPLRLLFAGALSQRKGLGDLFEAMRLLGRTKEVELVLLGSLCAPMEFYRSQGVPFTYETPRPNDAFLELMQSCDVLALPSLVEGRAIVQLEALSRGLPLLVTPNAGGDDLVIEGRTGFLVPARNPTALAEKIAWLLDNRTALPSMREACHERARAVSWESYRVRLIQVLLAALSPAQTISAKA